MSFFSNFYQRYGPLYSQNFISAQYPENKLKEIYQILYMHSCFFFCTMSWPLIDVRILFLLNVFRFSCLISLELGILLHEKPCSGAKVRFSDNSSLVLRWAVIFSLKKLLLFSRWTFDFGIGICRHFIGPEEHTQKTPQNCDDFLTH